MDDNWSADETDFRLLIFFTASSAESAVSFSHDFAPNVLLNSATVSFPCFASSRRFSFVSFWSPSALSKDFHASLKDCGLSSPPLSSCTTPLTPFSHASA